MRENLSLLYFQFLFLLTTSPTSAPALSLLHVREALLAPAVSQSAGLHRQCSTWFSMITVIVCAPVHAACRVDLQMMHGRKKGKRGQHRHLPAVTAFLKLTNFRTYYNTYIIYSINMHVQLYNAAKCGRYFIDVLSIFQSSGKLSPPHFSAQFTSKASFPLSSSFPL